MNLRIAVVATLLLAGLARGTEPITIYIAGDSTAAEKLAEKRPETGWGEKLQQYFVPSDVRVEDDAKNGRSTRTFISEGLWQGIIDHMKPGDYVFIQFGHNDESKEKVDRYTPPDDYRRNLALMVAQVREKKGFPVLLTPVYRRKFDEQRNVVDQHGVYPDIVRSVAAELRVPLIDMHRSSGALLQRIGPDSSVKLYLQLEPGENPNYPQGVHDNTHFRPLGAELMAGLAVQGIRESVPALAGQLRVVSAGETRP